MIILYSAISSIGEYEYLLIIIIYFIVVYFSFFFFSIADLQAKLKANDARRQEVDRQLFGVI